MAGSEVKYLLDKSHSSELIFFGHGSLWLVILFSEGYISLGLRSVMELGKYLKDEYSECIKYCTLCMELITANVSKLRKESFANSRGD